MKFSQINIKFAQKKSTNDSKRCEYSYIIINDMAIILYCRFVAICRFFANFTEIK